MSPRAAPPLTSSQLLIALWGLLGVLALLSSAIYRLSPIALEPLLEGGLTPVQTGAYAAWVLFNGYAEGYRAFQRKFSPRVVVRALYLAQNPSTLRVLLAPMFCMSFFHATRRGLVSAWVLTSLIICAVILVRQLPQPYRGIIDGGVVVGLAWGVLSLIIIFTAAVLGKRPRASGDLPSPSD